MNKMATLLLILICIIFVGLGLPDSVLGATWPAMHADIGATIGQANYISVLISLFTSVASFFSGRIVRKFGTGLTTTVSTALTAVGLLGVSFSNSLIITCLCSIPLGFGAGAIDSALNNYVAVHYKPKHMSFLHSFYGVGVLVTPYIISLALSNLNSWRAGYHIIFIVQIAITVFAIVAFPLWNKVKKIESLEEKVEERVLSFKQIAKIPAMRVLWIVFFSTCALEFTCGIWGASFLVKAEGFSEADGAKFITLYYLGIALSRFISGLIAGKVKSTTIIFSGFTLVGVAVILLVLPLPVMVKCVALFLVGFGNGPSFPNLTCLVPKWFGKDVSQSIIGTQMVACNLGICIMPPLFGVLADYVGLWAFPYYMLALYTVVIISSIFAVKMKKPKSEEIN